ncbi:MCM DNA helicase complex subunit [Pichia californica]|uniref:DNA replication licensing factor MCM2 n=1 Tax=Pichia californica TaxID=460514 RepID=A0A9P6WN72_9ASCO|nr:MCM DNA helicase complex subunit [[Candida] californica]KAG0690026.1 MCM DNA helicase complex subunit [[Candida] californica]
MSDRRSPRKRLHRHDDPSDGNSSSDEEVEYNALESNQRGDRNPLDSSPPPEDIPDLASSPNAGLFENDENDLENNSIHDEIEDDIRDLDDNVDDEMEEATGRDLIGDDMMDDYRERPEEDNYDDLDIDDAEVDEMDIGQRRQVDRMLNIRDDFSRRSQNLDLDESEDDEMRGLGSEDEFGLPNQRTRRRFEEDYDDENLAANEIAYAQLIDIKAPSVLDWISQPQVTRTIAREFKSFLLEFVDENGRSVYGPRIREMGESNNESLEVSYSHLLNSKAILADFLRQCPEEMLKIFDVVAMDATELHYPDYTQIHSEIHVRITDFYELLNLRDLRQTHLNNLIKIRGVVTRRTGIFPQLKYIKFDCPQCKTVLGPFLQDSNQEIKIKYCSNCEYKGKMSINSEQTVYRNYQRITVQESPGSMPAGRLPRHKEAILLWDLVDIAKPGEEVELTGIYKNSYDGILNAKNGFPVFATVIEANCIKRREGGSGDSSSGDDSYQITSEEEKKFRSMSHQPDIIDKIISSMAPSIYGHKYIKTAIACALFGGVPKDVNGKHSIRGDINVLLLGDPGTAKSQILKYVEKTAYRAVFSTGQGASAVGLTASVRKDPVTKEWTLEGGALVLADKGVCMIDEFDKMNDQDRTSIHEAMEQQSISISKAGIVTTLQARCSVIAAANPIGGRYNSTVDLQRNVNLTEPILSRFDVICVVRDLCNPENDERLATFVVDSHMRSYPEDEDEVGKDSGDEDMDSDDDLNEEIIRERRRKRLEKVKRAKESEISPIPQDLLIKYIYFARTRVQPKLNQMDMDKVSRVYADLRKESNTTGSFPITVRHLESILRIAEAFAKMRLSPYVSSSDLDRAIKVVVDSFIGAQKVSIKRQLQRSFMKYTLPHRARRPAGSPATSSATAAAA